MSESECGVIPTYVQRLFTVEIEADLQMRFCNSSHGGLLSVHSIKDAIYTTSISFLCRYTFTQ